MKKQGWFILSVLGLVICITSAPAHAQDGRISLFVGYSFGTNTYYSGDPGLHGYTAQAVYNINKHIGLEANFSGHNGTSPIYSEAYAGSDTYASVARQDLYAYTFGPKLFLPMGHFSLFTHFLVGAAHVHDGETDTCTAATGGSCSSGYPEQYSTRGNGFRIDHAFLSAALVGRAGAIRYSHDERLTGLSDHSVLLLDLDAKG